jgi:hypothetical protein
MSASHVIPELRNTMLVDRIRRLEPSKLPKCHAAAAGPRQRRRRRTSFDVRSIQYARTRVTTLDPAHARRVTIVGLICRNSTARVTR